MKRIGLIVFALLFVAIAVPVVLTLSLPRGKVTIAAIRPTGEFSTRTNGLGEVVRGPVWLFGVTNVGGVSASWSGTIVLRGPHVPARPPSPGDVDGWDGILRPGEGDVTEMTVAASSNTTEWSGHVTYSSEPTGFQGRLWSLGLKMPCMGPLVAHRLYDTFSDTPWHPATNAPVASSTVTNTP